MMKKNLKKSLILDQYYNYNILNMIKQKYQSVFYLGTNWKFKNGDVSEQNDVLKIKETAKTPYKKTLFGMKLKPLADKIRLSFKRILEFQMKVYIIFVR